MITEDPINPADVFETDIDPASGAVTVFCGVVRNENEGRPVRGIFYDCYREMARREIDTIVTDAIARFGLSAARVVHRVGELAVGEVSMLVLVSSGHRDVSFDALRHIVDAVKARVPIWKKERYDDGDDRWL
jgi:molybdopterin synthase catalytic subunit